MSERIFEMGAGELLTPKVVRDREKGKRLNLTILITNGFCQKNSVDTINRQMDKW